MRLRPQQDISVCFRSGKLRLRDTKRVAKGVRQACTQEWPTLVQAFLDGEAPLLLIMVKLRAQRQWL